MSATFFKDTSFSEATSPKINPKNDLNSFFKINKILNEKPKDGKVPENNSPEQNNTTTYGPKR